LESETVPRKEVVADCPKDSTLSAMIVPIETASCHERERMEIPPTPQKRPYSNYVCPGTETTRTLGKP
jgi:hypothetical protein